MKDLKEEVKKIAYDIGIDLIGVCDLEKDPLLKGMVKEYYEKEYNTTFNKKGFLKTFDYVSELPSYKSIIAFGVSYNFDYDETLKEGEYLISKSARGLDYHIYLKELATKLMEEVNKKYKVNYKINVDTSPLSDRSLAFLAGLGSYGKNTSIINKDFGSFLYLGHILVDTPLKPDFTYDNIRGKKCEDCDLCKKACPSGAILGDFNIDAKKCISYKTQKRIEDIDTKNYIYGCDICQNVCPYNKEAKNSTHSKLYGKRKEYIISIKEEESITKEDFYKKFSQSSLRWIGFKRYRRNVKDLLNKEINLS